MSANSPVAAPSAFILLFGLLAVAHAELRLATPRPRQPRAITPPIVLTGECDCKVPVRSWEDPLRAVYLHVRNLRDGKDLKDLKDPKDDAAKPDAVRPICDCDVDAGSPVPEGREAFGPESCDPAIADVCLNAFPDLPARRRLQEVVANVQGDAEELRLVGLLVRSGGNAEDRHVRLECRRALQFALGADPEFRAVDPEHLWFARDVFGRRGQESNPLPIEVFAVPRKAGEPRARIAVLWLDEDVLGPKPLHSISQLVSAWRCASQSCKPVDFTLVGPTRSDVLTLMIAELRELGAAPKGVLMARPLFQNCIDGRVTLYSPWATIPITDDERKDLDGQRAVRIVRTIGDDALLQQALRHEVIDLRQIDPSDVALFVEWGTGYGEALARLFTNAAGRVGMTIIRYPRGVDGYVPSRSADEKSKPDSPEASTDEPRSEGTTLMDAVVRLRESGRWTDFKAIGILGTDVYDKILLLRAMRDVCPNAVFFTTDLDARLLCRKEREATHNLVIASHFGLELGERLQTGAMPFRSGYQTATFLSLSIALRQRPGGVEPVSAAWKTVIDDLAALEAAPSSGAVISFPGEAPRVYELGNGGALDLTTNRPSPIFPTSPRSVGWSFALILGVVLLGLAAVAAVVLRTVNSLHDGVKGSSADRGDPTPRQWFDRWLTGRPLALAALVAFSVVLAVGLVDGFRNDDGEPFTVFDGTSVWPTCALRVIALALAAYYAGHIVRRLRDSEADAARLLSLPSPMPSGRNAPAGSIASRIWGRVKPLLIGGSAAWPDDDAPKAPALWRAFVRHDDHRSTGLRVVIRTALGCMIVAALFIVFGGLTSPARGVTAIRFDWFTLVPCLFALILLNVFVYDTAIGQISLMTRFHPRRVRWEKALQRRHAGVPDEAEEAWQTLDFLGRRSEMIERFIYFPFVILLIMIVIHHPVFDAFSRPWVLLITYGVCFLSSLVAGYLLWSSAKQTRKDALGAIDDFTALARAENAPSDAKVEALLRLRKEIEDYDVGVFDGFISNPALRALLIPSGGVGLLALAQFGLGQ